MTTIAGRSPATAIRIGLATEPRPTPSAMSASKTPKARASTASLTRRTGRVKRGTSMIAFATPTTAMSAKSSSCRETAPIATMGRPHRARARESQAPRWRLPTSSDAPNEPRTPADAEGRGQGGHPAVVGAEQVEGDDHDEDVERSPHDGLREAEAEHEAQVAVRGDHAHALDRVLRDPASRARDGRWGVGGDAEQREHGEDGHRREDDEGRGRARHREHDPGQHGAGQRGHGLEHAAHHVGARELGRVGAQERLERGVDRPEDRHRRGDDDGQGVDRHRGRAGGEEDRGGGERRGPDHGRDDEDPLPPQAVGIGGEDGRPERGRQHPQQRHQPDRSRATFPERDHPERHRERGVARAGQAIGDLGPAQRWSGADVAQGDRGGGEAAADPASATRRDRDRLLHRVIIAAGSRHGQGGTTPERRRASTTRVSRPRRDDWPGRGSVDGVSR